MTLSSKKMISLQTRMLFAAFAIVAAVSLPQALHFLGKVSGTGKSLAVWLLPMHLPIIAAGIFAGPLVGMFSGFFAPAVNALLTGLPAGISLPLMVAELSAYGFFAGIFAKTKLPCAIQVLATQLLGRVVRMLVVVLAVCAFKKDLPIAGIWISSVSGLAGIALQLALIPLAVKKYQNAQK